MRKACERASVEPATWTDIRRSKCTRMREDGVSAEHAAEFMGHASTAMVRQVYGRLQGKELGKVMER